MSSVIVRGSSKTETAPRKKGKLLQQFSQKERETARLVESEAAKLEKRREKLSPDELRKVLAFEAMQKAMEQRYSSALDGPVITAGPEWLRLQ